MREASKTLKILQRVKTYSHIRCLKERMWCINTRDPLFLSPKDYAVRIHFTRFATSTCVIRYRQLPAAATITATIVRVQFDFNRIQATTAAEESYSATTSAPIYRHSKATWLGWDHPMYVIQPCRINKVNWVIMHI